MTTKRKSSKKVPTHKHLRKAYSRKAYTRSSGVRVKAARVPSRYITVRGLGRPRVIPRLKKGVLEPYNYHTSSGTGDRHRTLVKAAKDKGYAEIIRHLNAIAILMKNSNPEAADIIRDDMRYLKEHRLEYDKSEKAKRMIARASRKKSRRARR